MHVLSDVLLLHTAYIMHFVIIECMHALIQANACLQGGTQRGAQGA